MITNNLQGDVKKCLIDPVQDILYNFSLEKSREFYEKRATQWNSGNYKQNPADKEEKVNFDFGSLSELGLMTTQAHNLYVNLKKEEFNKGVDWYIFGQNIVVSWHRLKTFEEWLHDGLYEALCQAYKTPEEGARMILEKKLGKGVYTNTAVHMFAEGILTEDVLKRLGQYEKYQPIENRNIEEDIEKCVELLSKQSEKCDEKKETTVLTFKI